MSCEVLGKHFLSRVRISLNMILMDMMMLGKEELMVKVTYTQCKQAKEWVPKYIEGKVDFEIEKL